VALAILLPFINNYLEDVAGRLTEYENHRTQDHYEMSRTQKIFVLQSITNYLPILLTAFVYVPYGKTIIPLLRNIILSAFGVTPDPNFTFRIDPDRLRNEVIALTVTGQVSSAIEELALPYLKTGVKDWWRTYRTNHTFTGGATGKWRKGDDPAEARFLRRVRKQASLPSYDVHEDISEMVLQFGYLALFSPVWPLVPIGFFINNWFELRADIIKICIEHQRPDPIRSDGIGPWVASLEALTWLGSLTSAAIVHLFGTHGVWGIGKWWGLPVTVFASEHIFLGLRAVVRWALQTIGSKHIRQERAERYAERKKYLDELNKSAARKGHLDVAERERRKSVRMTAADVFWTRQVEEGASRAAGIGLIRSLRGTESTVDVKLSKTD
jgi:anoctamin-10